MLHEQMPAIIADQCMNINADVLVESTNPGEIRALIYKNVLRVILELSLKIISDDVLIFDS